MKKSLLFIVVALSVFTLTSCASSTPVTIDPIVESFEAEGTKDELYVAANNWMVENFNSAKSVIQFSDKEAGIVTGKYLLKETYTYSGYTATAVGIFAIIKIQVKDGAARVTVTPDNFNSVSSSLVKEEYQYTKEKAVAQIQSLIDSLKNYMKNDNSNDW
ncbi:MAG TPA: DUF4468 domain-containing protein [Salinimicrobium sp.]|nr:DUF4468 domain-containing protein [Salinimicrobium sp.]